MTDTELGITPEQQEAALEDNAHGTPNPLNEEDFRKYYTEYLERLMSSFKEGEQVQTGPAVQAALGFAITLGLSLGYDPSTLFVGFTEMLQDAMYANQSDAPTSD